MVAPAVKSHHTVWVQHGSSRPVAARYAVSGENLVAFGDDGLAELHDGDRVVATVHEIAGGPPVATFGATVRSVPPDRVDMEALLELVAHVPLGRTMEEVKERLDELRRSRRIVALVP